jgi:SAM-dependent methyltransferase
MKLVKIDPPGTWCFREAFSDLLRKRKISQSKFSFVEVGCGGGDLSKILCDQGHTGMGVDFSSQAIAIASNTLKPHIDSQHYTLMEGDITESSLFGKYHEGFDTAFSMMVMEHVHDDIGFLKNLARLTRPGGSVIVAVPGRMDRWNIEDDTVGHLRRYESGELKKIMSDSGLQDVEVWSVAVPVANLLFNISNLLVRRSQELQKINVSQREQTETSGIREIPFKTVFPAWCKILLNRVTLYPLFVIQRLFYRSNLGLVMMGVGRVPSGLGE